jgi:hypothetical protein
MKNRKKRITGLKCRVKGNRIIFYSELAELFKNNKIHILADGTLLPGEYNTYSPKVYILELNLRTQKCGNLEATNKRLAEVWRIVFATDDTEFWLEYNPKTRLFTKL